MSSLFVDRKNIDVRMDAGALTFYENDVRVGTVPAAPLDRVVFKGSATLSTKVLGELGQHGIGVIVLTGYKNEPTIFFPSPHNDARRRIAQCVLSLDAEYRRLFAVDVIREKVAGQVLLIDDLAKSHPQPGMEFERCRQWLHQDYTRIDAKTTMEELRGIEGHAATAYFQAIAAILPESLCFSKRARRPPTDPFNVILSLTYTLFIAESALAIYKAGLDPFVGFLHTVDFGRTSFACDLVEVCRPQADRFAIELFHSKTLRPEDFSTTAKGCLLGKAGRTRYYPAYEAAADAWRSQMDRKALKSAQDFVSELEIRQRNSNLPTDVDIPF